MGKSKYKTWLFVNKFISNYHLYLLIILFCILKEKCSPGYMNFSFFLFKVENGVIFMQCIPYFFLTKETCMDASWLSWILMIIASFYFVLIIIIISGSLQICTGIFWTWIYWKGHGCKLTCSEVLFIHT